MLSRKLAILGFIFALFGLFFADRAYANQLPIEPQASKGTIVALGDDDRTLLIDQNQTTVIQFKARLNNGKQPVSVKWEILGFIDPSLSLTTDGAATDILKVNLTGKQLGFYGLPLQATLTLKSGKKIKLGENFTINVRPRPTNEDFKISTVPKNVTINSGSSATVSVLIEGLNGFDAGVVLSGTAKEGLSLQFRDQFVLPNSNTDLLITASASLSEGATTVQITGSSGTLTRTALLEVTIKRPTNVPDPVIIRIGKDECGRKRLPDAQLGPVEYQFTADNFIQGRHKWFLSSTGSYYSHPFVKDPVIDPDTGKFTAVITDTGIAVITIHITDSLTTPPDLSKDSASFEFVSKVKLLQDFPVNINKTKIRDGESLTINWSAPNPGGRTIIYLMNEDCEHPERALIQPPALLVLEGGGNSVTIELKAPLLCLECNRFRYRIRVHVTDPSAPGQSLPGVEPAVNGAYQGTSELFEIVPRPIQ